MPPISVSGSTLNRAANPTPFLSTDVPSQRTVRTTAGLIPASSWLRYNDDRYAFEGLHHKKDRTTRDSPPPRASSPDFPPPSEREAERRDLNQRANTAKEAADADPGNEAKALEYRQLCEDYAADFGLFVPDAEIDKHLILRRQESTRLDGLWEQAFKKGCPVSNRAPLQAYMDAAEEFNATFGQPYQRYDGKAADLTSKCQMLVLYKEFLDGCRGDLEEEFRIVGQRLHEISWVNPFPLGDSRRAALDTKLRARANIAPESNFRSTLEDATVTLTYLNSDYRKPSSVRCRRKYLKHKLLVIELAAMQAAAEAEARQRECNRAARKTARNRSATVLHGRPPATGAQPCCADTARNPSATVLRGIAARNRSTTVLRGIAAHNPSATVLHGILPATRAQPCCAEDRPQPERNRAARNTAHNRSTTVLRGIATHNPSANRAARNTARNPSATHNRAAWNSRPQPERNRAARNTARNPSTTVLRGIPPATQAQPCCAEYRPQPERNRAARNTARNRSTTVLRGIAAHNPSATVLHGIPPATRAQPCCAEYRPQPEHNRAARNTARNPSTTVLHGIAARNPSFLLAPSNDRRQPRPLIDDEGESPCDNKAPTPLIDDEGESPCDNKAPTPLIDDEGESPCDNKAPTPLIDDEGESPCDNKAPTPLIDDEGESPCDNKAPTPFIDDEGESPRDAEATEPFINDEGDLARILIRYF
ncbi:hypothetical protein B0H14DRAFT_3485386 [Mycena olivaceomarginata]|nr:hypothetical protein B0H14DRAFT_3485386 [Mycena olivaceomarginata]